MQNKTTNIRKLTGTAMLGAVAAVLMYMEFPIPIMPSFVKLDVSELPALLAAYAYGPVSGIAVCLIKNLIKLPSTSTAAVGELFNFVMGALFVGVAGFRLPGLCSFVSSAARGHHRYVPGHQPQRGRPADLPDHLQLPVHLV